MSSRRRTRTPRSCGRRCDDFARVWAVTAAAAGARPAAVMVLPGTEGEEMASLRRPARHVAGLPSEQPWLAIAWDWSRGSRGGGGVDVDVDCRSRSPALGAKKRVRSGLACRRATSDGVKLSLQKKTGHGGEKMDRGASVGACTSTPMQGPTPRSRPDWMTALVRCIE